LVSDDLAASSKDAMQASRISISTKVTLKQINQIDKIPVVYSLKYNCSWCGYKYV